MSVPGYRDMPGQQWDPQRTVDSREAEDFLDLYHRENPQRGDVRERLARVVDEIAETGTYTHTYAELVFGCRVAWRNASRCIGRLYWRSLVVRDLRKVGAPDEIFEELVRHLRLAGQRERNVIRPVISVFGQHVPGRGAPRLWNEQLIRYAGHRLPDGTVLGDPRTVGLTDVARSLGWCGAGTRFDVLPLIVNWPGEPPAAYELPADAVLEVPLAHPRYGWFAELDLRWHAVPVISDLKLRVGGVDYPLAPFNGWYMGTEIGVRNLADPDRYDQLPVIAGRLGLDTSHDATLWRDRALVELNRAVLWSFERAGVRMTDHHTEARRFVAHLEREHRAGRPTPADWTWIVPPLSGALTPVYHRYYHEADERPNFYSL